MAQEGAPQKFAEAIVLARKIDSQLFARAKAEKEIEGWSRTLLAMATKRLGAKDLPGAIEAASVVPQDSPLFAEAQDLMQLGRAQAVMWNQSISTPLAQHIFTLLEGRGAASQIAPGRPLYKQAQVQIENLQVQFQDLLRLQVASTIASFGQVGTFGLAIEQAQTIGAKQRGGFTLKLWWLLGAGKFSGSKTNLLSPWRSSWQKPERLKESRAASLSYSWSLKTPPQGRGANSLGSVDQTHRS